MRKPFVKKYLFYYFILWQKNGVAGIYSNHSLFMGASDLAFIFSYLSTMDQDSKISSKKSRASWSYWKWGLKLFTEWRKSFMFKCFAWLSKSRASSSPGWWDHPQSLMDRNFAALWPTDNNSFERFKPLLLTYCLTKRLTGF